MLLAVSVAVTRSCCEMHNPWFWSPLPSVRCCPPGDESYWFGLGPCRFNTHQPCHATPARPSPVGPPAPQVATIGSGAGGQHSEEVGGIGPRAADGNDQAGCCMRASSAPDFRANLHTIAARRQADAYSRDENGNRGKRMAKWRQSGRADEVRRYRVSRGPTGGCPGLTRQRWFGTLFLDG